MTLELTYKNSGKDIKVFSNGKLFWHIPSISKNVIAKINNIDICFSQEGIFGQNRFFYDPKDDKAYCSFSDNSIECPAFKYFIRDRIKFDKKTITRTYTVLYSEKNTIESELHFNRFFFPKSGTIEIMNTNNLEIKIYALFFINHLHLSRPSI